MHVFPFHSLSPSRAQIQAQIKLAATLRQMADAAGKNNMDLEGMDIAGDLVSKRETLPTKLMSS